MMKISHILTFSLLFAFALSLNVPSVYAQNKGKKGATTQGQAAAKQTAKATPKEVPQTTATTTQSAPVADAEKTQPSEEPQLSEQDQALFNEAMEKFKKQDFAGSLESLRQLTSGNPSARPPRLILARWFMDINNAQAVRTCFELATEENPDDPEAFYSLAEISLSEGALTAAELLTLRGDQALAKYTSNETRKTKLTGISYRLKLAYANARNRWADAQNAALGLIKLEGETAELDRAYARLLFQQNQDAKAKEILVRAEKLEKDPANALPADATMAQLYAGRGDEENAEKSLAAALKAAPKSKPTLLLSITHSLRKNDIESAQKSVEQLYQDDKSADVLKTYGKVALFRSDYETAEKTFQEVVRQNPLDAEAATCLALALCEQNDDEKRKRAVQYAAGNVQKQSNNRDFLATFGWTLYKAGQIDDALKVLQQSTADGQVNAASAYYFAVILNEKGQKDAAKKLLAAALSTTEPFAKRAAATELLAQLNSEESKE